MPERPRRQSAHIKHRDLTPVVQPTEDRMKIENEIQTALRALGLTPSSLPASMKRPKRQLRAVPAR